MIYRVLVAFFVVFPALLISVGCDSGSRGLPVEYVEGVVTLDGEAVEGASVIFYPTGSTGESAGGVTDATGTYKLTSENGDLDKGALAGTYKVTVRKVESTSYLNLDGTIDPKAPIDRTTGQPITTVQKELLPSEYSQVSKTPLEFTVATGENTLPITLTSK